MLEDYVNNKPVLETGRLLLRPLVREDAEDLRQWMGDEALYLYWGKRPGKTDLNPALLFEKAQRPSKSFHWGIARKADGKVIGEMWVYLIERGRKAKTAFRLSREHWGKGFATEALKRTVEFCFDNTELRRLWTDVHIDNAASVRVLEKAGFTRENTVTQSKMVSTVCDYHIYALEKERYTDSMM